MKRLTKQFQLLLACLFIVSCTGKQADSQQQQFEDAFNTTEELQLKAEQDSNFSNSKEYAAQMERAAIEMSKKTANLQSNEKMLLEFELAIKSLKQSMDEVKKKPELSHDLTFKKAIKTKSDKVLLYYQSIKKLNLSAAESHRFKELNR